MLKPSQSALLNHQNDQLKDQKFSDLNIYLPIDPYIHLSTLV